MSQFTIRCDGRIQSVAMRDAIPERQPSAEDKEDLGFGAVVSDASRARLLNRDGSFNVIRRGLPWRATLSPYIWLLGLSWHRFLGVLALFYLALNVLFALGYLAIGPGALAGAAELDVHGRFWRAFFFSVESLSTVGYGHIVPVGLAANLLMTVESYIGILMVALATGIAFSRFSRPRAHILFSERALIAPYRGITSLQFRIINQKKSQLVEVDAQVIYSRFETVEGKRTRRYDPLPLERRRVAFFPLAWTVVHPIDEQSPLFGLSREQALAADVEILVLLNAHDEVSSQTVHTRSSYRAEEIVWGARFENLFLNQGPGAPLAIDAGKIHAVAETASE